MTYRNLNRTYPGGTRYLGSPRTGELAIAIPATGQHGAALAYANVQANGWTTQRILWWVRSNTLSTLFVDGQSAALGAVPGDGAYTITADVYVDDVLQGTQATTTLSIGNVYALQGAGVSGASQLSSVAMSYSPPGASSYSLQASPLTGSGQLASEAMSYTAPGGISSLPRRRVHLSFPPPRIGGLRSLGGE